MRYKFWILWLFLLPSISLAVNDVTQYKLTNGLQLIVKQDHRAPVAIVSIWYKVGGSYEHNGITGISHVLEHMMFRGTHKHPAGQLEKIVSDNGGQQNAMTAEDFTMYYENIAANKLPIIFALEADRMRNLLLTKQDFAKEIQVVMEERRMRTDDNPQALTQERLTAAALVNNPYHHPVVGWMTDLKHMTVQNLRDWYNTWYVPNNATIVVVGDVQPTKVYALAKQYFGPMKAKSLPAIKPRMEIAPLGLTHLELSLPAKLPYLFLAYQTPSLVTSKAPWQAYALDVLDAILSGSNSSRLNRDLIRGQQVAVAADTSYNPLQLYTTLLIFAGSPSPGHSIKDLKQAFLQQIHHLQTTLVSQQELERIKAQVIASDVFGQDSLMAQAFKIGMPEMVGLPWQVGRDYAKRVLAVTPEQIQAVAKMYLTRKRLTMAILHPISENKPKPNQTGKQS